MLPFIRIFNDIAVVPFGMAELVLSDFRKLPPLTRETTHFSGTLNAFERVDCVVLRDVVVLLKSRSVRSFLCYHFFENPVFVGLFLLSIENMNFAFLVEINF